MTLLALHANAPRPRANGKCLFACFCISGIQKNTSNEDAAADGGNKKSSCDDLVACQSKPACFDWIRKHAPPRAKTPVRTGIENSQSRSTLIHALPADIAKTSMQHDAAMVMTAIRTQEAKRDQKGAAMNAKGASLDANKRSMPWG